MTPFEWVHVGILIVTIIAIIVGPIVAVNITRKRDQEKEVRDRKFYVFRDVMRTRGVQIDPVHVAALNVIEIDFYNEPQIVSDYRNYIRHLRRKLPGGEQDLKLFVEERDDLFLSLVHSMGKHLGYSFDKRELQQTGYAPDRWFADQDLQRANAIRLAELLEGRRPLPIQVHQPN